MHWVVIGSGVAIAGGVYGSFLSRSSWPLLGAALVTGGMYLAYVHAVKRGKGKPAPANGNGGGRSATVPYSVSYDSGY